MSHRYRMWGLLVEADMPLADWPIPVDRSEEPPDVIVRLTDDPEFWSGVELAPRVFTRVIGDDELAISRFREGWVWRYPDDATFFVSDDGRDARARWPAEYVVADALTYFVGPIFGFILRRRGIPSLHAGTVLVDGGAVAFAGGPGAGKSSLTAEFVRRGFTMLGDDVAALELCDDTFFVRPSVPLVKLWEDAARRSGNLPWVSPSWPKRMLAIAEGSYATQPAPLRAVYLLGHDAGPVGPAEALAFLSANVYVHYARDHEAQEADLEFFARLVERVPVRGLVRPPRLDDIGERVDNLLEDLKRCR